MNNRSSGLLLAAIAVVVMACGCSVGPDLDEPVPEPVAQTPADKAPELISGSNYPYRQSGIKPFMPLDSVSTDPSYGYTSENPIEIGGGFPDGDMDIYRYLNALLDPEGNPISYSRLGTCCAFEHDPGLLGSGQGVLDVYLIDYQGLETPVRLYFNTFAYEQPLAPYGLKYQQE